MRLPFVPLCVVLSLVLGVQAQGQPQCELSDLSNNLEPLIADAITLGDSAQDPDILVLDSQTVCLAAGSTRNRYRYASVVVFFNCMGSLSAGNPLGISSSCNSNLTVQFDFECTDPGSGPEWDSAATLGGDNVFNPADGNLTTTLRTDCSFCVDPARAGLLWLTVDMTTHCAECNADCTGPVERCVGLAFEECCNFYQGDVCVTECDVLQGFEPVGTDCMKMCVELTDPSNGQVNVPEFRTVGSEATYSCDEGYMLVAIDGDTRNCTQLAEDIPQWVPITEPMCQIITCEELVAPLNGTLNLTSGNDFGSVVSYFCDDGFELVGNSTRMCQSSRNWTGSDPTCEEELSPGSGSGVREDDDDPFDDDDVDDIDIVFIVLGIVFFFIVAAILVFLVLYGIYKRRQE